MIMLSTDDLDASIDFYSGTLGLPLKFRDGTHFARLDGGSVTLALATNADHQRRPPVARPGRRRDQDR
jgi:catechol 2,3-dioxygenase-like lactoylglutathione lyase family enzyme